MCDGLNHFGYSWSRPPRRTCNKLETPLCVTRYYLIEFPRLHSLCSHCGTVEITLFFLFCFLWRFHVFLFASFILHGNPGTRFFWFFLCERMNQSMVWIDSHVMKYCLACHWHTLATVLVATSSMTQYAELQQNPNATHLRSERRNEDGLVKSGS